MNIKRAKKKKKKLQEKAAGLSQKKRDDIVDRVHVLIDSEHLAGALNDFELPKTRTSTMDENRI